MQPTKILLDILFKIFYVNNPVLSQSSLYHKEDFQQL